MCILKSVDINLVLYCIVLHLFIIIIIIAISIKTEEIVNLKTILNIFQMYLHKKCHLINYCCDYHNLKFNI